MKLKRRREITKINKNMKIRSWVLFALAVPVLCWVGYVWLNCNPLNRYGIFYEKTYGEHIAFQHIQFYWNRDGKKIMGPQITGDELYVRFKRFENIPQIIVRSKVYKNRMVVLRLNFNDASKPEFELVENNMMGVWYFPPWDGYYKRDPDTQELKPKH